MIADWLVTDKANVSRDGQKALAVVGLAIDTSGVEDNDKGKAWAEIDGALIPGHDLEYVKKK